MKKLTLFIAVVLGLIIFSIPAFAWQGRMAGMSDPTGLIYDESDLLVHPAKIADGQGVAHGASGLPVSGVPETIKIISIIQGWVKSHSDTLGVKPCLTGL